MLTKYFYIIYLSYSNIFKGSNKVLYSLGFASRPGPNLRQVWGGVTDCVTLAFLNLVQPLGLCLSFMIKIFLKRTAFKPHLFPPQNILHLGVCLIAPGDLIQDIHSLPEDCMANTVLLSCLHLEARDA